MSDCATSSSVLLDSEQPFLSGNANCTDQDFQHVTPYSIANDSRPSRRISPRITIPSAKAQASSACSSSSEFSSAASSRSNSTAPTSVASSTFSSPKSTRIRAPNAEALRLRRVLERYNKLANDPCIVPGSVKETSVQCMGCKQQLKLDSRQQYYAGLWIKHRAICRGLSRLGLAPAIDDTTTPAKGKGKKRAATATAEPRLDSLWSSSRTKVRFQPYPSRSANSSTSSLSRYNSDSDSVEGRAESRLSLMSPVKWHRKQFLAELFLY